MLTVPRLRGAAQLRLFVQELTFDRACKILKVHPTTLRRWLRDDPEPPQAALLALYWLTHYGWSDAQSQAHWSHQFMVRKVERLEQVLAFNPPAHWQASNESEFRAPGLQWSMDWPDLA